MNDDEDELNRCEQHKRQPHTQFEKDTNARRGGVKLKAMIFIETDLNSDLKPIL